MRPKVFEYVYRAIKKDLHLASISGGTDKVEDVPGAPAQQKVQRLNEQPSVGIGVTRLRDAPAEWGRQFAMLGLSV